MFATLAHGREGEMQISLEQAIVLFIMMLVANIPGLLASVVGYIKSRTAIDANTELTKASADAAIEHSAEAAKTSKQAASVASDISKKLNGNLEKALAAAVEPVSAKLQEHTEQDARDLAEVKRSFAELSEYVHKRNHELANTLQTLHNGMNLILAKLGEK